MFLARGVFSSFPFFSSKSRNEIDFVTKCCDRKRPISLIVEEEEKEKKEKEGEMGFVAPVL